MISIKVGYLSKPIVIGVWKCKQVIYNKAKIQAFVNSGQKDGSLEVAQSQFKHFVLNYYQAYAVLEWFDEIVQYVKDIEPVVDGIAFEKHLQSKGASIPEPQQSYDEESLKEKMNRIANE